MADTHDDENGNIVGTNLIRQVPRKRTHSMANFKEKYESFNTGNFKRNARLHVGTQEPVDYITSNDDVMARRLIKTLSATINEGGEADEGVQLCTYLISIITLMMPSLENEGMEAMRGLGGAPVKRELPRDDAFCALELAETATTPYCYCAFAQAIFIMFRNLNNLNYTAFMNRRIDALKPIVGAPPSASDLLLLSESKGIMLHKRMKACKAFKKALLPKLMEYSTEDHTFGQMSAYILSMLAWTDMSSLVFISRNLLFTRSPVLRDGRVLGEVTNLARAFDTINRTPFPQFFKIYHSPRDCLCLERNKFSVLVAVAVRIDARSSRTVSRFVSPRMNDDIVTELYNLHITSVQNTVSIAKAVNYLVEYDDEEYGVVNEVPAGPVQRNIEI